MTNAPPHSSSGTPQHPYSSPSTNVPRRTSYASVVAARATPPRPGGLSHLMNPSSPASTDLPDTQQPHGSPPRANIITRRDISMDSPPNWDTEAEKQLSPLRVSAYASPLGAGSRGAGDMIRPTHLRGSRYMEQYEAAYKAKVKARTDAAANHTSNPSALSRSSSSVSLHKMAPSHRGMTYEIIEHQPPSNDTGPSPLPLRWNEADKNRSIDIEDNGSSLKYTSPLAKLHDHEAAAVRADQPMPPQCGIYYYEIHIHQTGKEDQIGIGFSGPKASLEKLPGWEPDSWAYHGDDGKSWCCQLTGKTYGPKFTTGDVVGCGVNFWTRTAFFTKNGVNLGIAFRDLNGVDLFPSVGIKRPTAKLSANFGQVPFVFDIDGMMKQEKARARDEANAADVSKLYSNLPEHELVKELVAQFLAHGGYVETAQAFAEEARNQDAALNTAESSAPNKSLIDPDLDARNRQQIRAAILEGDIDKALKRTHAYYPQVLKDNSQIYFRLRCRKFVEMIRQSTEIIDMGSQKRNKKANGHAPTPSNDILEPEMEVDDQASIVEDFDEMDTEEADSAIRYDNALEEMIRYGQELKSEFRDDRSRAVEDALKGIFAMFAYVDPRDSPTAFLLDEKGRVPVAEELNSAILVSQGKSSSAAVERLYQQTKALVDVVADDDGWGQFIHVRNDYIK